MMHEFYFLKYDHFKLKWSQETLHNSILINATPFALWNMMHIDFNYF